MEAFRHMSLTDKMVNSITMKSEYSLDAKTKSKAQEVTKKKSDLEKVEADLHNLEKKWLAEQINFETYNRWHNDYTKQRNYLRAQIDQDKIYRTPYLIPELARNELKMKEKGLLIVT